MPFMGLNPVTWAAGVTYRAPSSNNCRPLSVWLSVVVEQNTFGISRKCQERGKLPTIVRQSPANFHKQAISGLTWRALKRVIYCINVELKLLTLNITIVVFRFINPSLKVLDIVKNYSWELNNQSRCQGLYSDCP